MAYVYQNANKTDKPLLPSHNYSAASRSCLTVDENATLDGVGRMPPKRTNSNLEELSEELDRRTRETQQLQREVERATQLTIERMGRTLGTSPLQTYPLRDSLLKENIHAVPSLDREPLAEPARDIQKGSLEQYSAQVSMLQRQLSETHKLHEQQKLLLRDTIMRLQAQLHEVQVEKQAQAEWSMMESRRYAEVQENLRQKQEAVERALQEVAAVLSTRAERVGGPAYASLGPEDFSQLSVGIAVDVALREMETENATLQTRLQRLDEQLKAVKSESQEQAELLLKVQTERKQAEAQVSVYQTQASGLEASLSELHTQLLEAKQAHQAQTGELQQQLTTARAQAEEAKRDRELSIQQAQQQDSLLCQLKAELHQVQEELNLQRGQNQQLCERDTAHGSAMRALRTELDQRRAEVQQLEEEVASLKQERRNREEARDNVAVQLELEGRDAVVEQMQVQLECLAQLSAQQNRSLDAMKADRNHLNNQLNQHRLELQQLKSEQARFEQQQVHVGALEQELVRAHAALAQKTLHLKEVGLERQHLVAEVEVQNMQLDALSEEQVALKESHVAQQAELEGANAQLRSQLQAVREDLDQAKSTLRALQDADGQGLKVAVSMQKRITSKRQQIDGLQGRIQLLEETVERLSQEKHTWVTEERRHRHHLAKARAERQRLQADVKAQHRLEMQLRDRVRELEAALDRMSERFSECQDYMQQQEQEVVRLRLRHTLDVRERQGLNLHTTRPLQPPELESCQNDSGFPEQKPRALQENPTSELRLLVQELRDMVEDNHRPHPRRRSAPERLRPSGLETGPWHTAKFEDRSLHHTSCKGSGLPGAQRRCGSLPQETELQLGIGSRSPVYSLLTSSPEKPPPLVNNCTTDQQVELTEETWNKVQGDSDSLSADLKPSSTEITSTVKEQHKRIRRRAKDRNKL